MVTGAIRGACSFSRPRPPHTHSKVGGGMPRPGFGRGRCGPAPWSRVLGVAGTVTCSRGTSNLPPFPPAPRCLLPTATSRSPPAAAAPALRSHRGLLSSREARRPQRPAHPEVRLQPRPLPPPRGGRTRAPVLGRRLGSWGGGWGRPGRRSRHSRGLGGGAGARWARKGERGQDGAEFFRAGRVLTRVGKARGRAGRSARGIRAGAAAGRSRGGGIGEDKALAPGAASRVLPPPPHQRRSVEGAGSPAGVHPEPGSGAASRAIHPAALGASGGSCAQVCARVCKGPSSDKCHR